MRVVMLTSSFPASEGDYRGRFVLEMAADWAQQGHRVTVVAPHPGLGAQDNEEFMGVQVRQVRGARGTRGSQGGTLFGGSGVVHELTSSPWRILSVPGHLSALREALHEECRQADFVLSHWLAPFGLMGAEAALKADVPHGVVEHGAGVRLLQWGGVAAARAVKHWLSGTVAIQWVASHQQAWANRCGLTLPGFVFPMPLPDHAFEPVVSRNYGSPLRLLWLARMVHDKGGHVLIQALQQARDVDVTFAGDGPERRHLERQAAGLASGRVRFLGQIRPEEVSGLMDQHDLFGFTSLPMRSGEEGTPRALLEAMARGTIPVASLTGGVADWVRHMENGLTYRPGDSRALALLLTQLGVAKEQCPGLSLQARKSVEGLTWSGLRAVWSATCRQAGLGVL